jgi:hypothetical protein
MCSISLDPIHNRTSSPSQFGPIKKAPVIHISEEGLVNLGGSLSQRSGFEPGGSTAASPLKNKIHILDCNFFCPFASGGKWIL